MFERTSYNDLVLSIDTENQFFHMIHQYSFDYWIREGTLSSLNLILHADKILKEQDTGVDVDHVDLLLEYLNIRVFPTNVLNYIYNVTSIVTFYLLNNSNQILKKVNIQIQNFMQDSIQFGFTPFHNEPLEPENTSDDDFINPFEEAFENNLLNINIIPLDTDSDGFYTDSYKINLKCVDITTTNGTNVINSEDDEENARFCPICLTVESYIQTNCGHCFCDCAITHCLKSNSCPLCRQTIKELTIQDKKNYRIISSCLKYDIRFVSES